MKRRSFITGLLSLAALPLVAKAKPVEPVWFGVDPAKEGSDKTVEFNVLVGSRGSAKTNAVFDHVWKGDFNVGDIVSIGNEGSFILDKEQAVFLSALPK